MFLYFCFFTFYLVNQFHVFYFYLHLQMKESEAEKA